MEALYVTAITLAAVLVAAGVSFFTKTILDRQTQLAKQMNELAGVLKVRSLSDAGPYELFRDVLVSRPPIKRLDIWAVSSSTVLRPEIVHRLLDAGVQVRALLLDPESQATWLTEHPWFANETRDTLKRVQDLGRSFRTLQVRMYQDIQIQMLLFVDDDRVFVSPFFPLTSRACVIFEIAPGDRSLYQLYRDAFDYVWKRSREID